MPCPINEDNRCNGCYWLERASNSCVIERIAESLMVIAENMSRNHAGRS